MTTRRVFLFEYLSACAGHLGDSAATTLRAEGLIMRDALGADLAAMPDVELSVATDRRDPSLESGRRSSATPVCALAGESPIDFVARMAPLHDLVWVIAPETGGLLAALNEVVSPRQWIGCDGASIRLASSKQATLARLQDRGIATPLAFTTDPAVRHWVVKPDDGAGSLHTHRHRDAASAGIDLQQRMRDGQTATLEPWVDGDALSLSLWARSPGVELLAVNRQRLAIETAGSVSLIAVDIAVTDLDADRLAALAQIARAVCAALPGLAGWVGIDLVWHATRGPVVIEVNPRITSAYVGMSAALRRNLAADILAAHDAAWLPTEGVDVQR